LEVEQEVRAARPETTEKVNIGSMLFFWLKILSGVLQSLYNPGRKSNAN
jgi:hypothetical protein